MYLFFSKFKVKISNGTCKKFMYLRSPSVSGPAEQPAGGSDVISLSSWKQKLYKVKGMYVETFQCNHME